MSGFKFQLGDVVTRKMGDTNTLYTIEAFHLNGFMRIRRLDTEQIYMVRDTDYRRTQTTDNN